MGNADVYFSPNRAREAKAIVALAFRNGPIEAVHAGKPCPTCAGNTAYSHITNAEMKEIMKHAVNKIYELLWKKEEGRESYEDSIRFGSQYTVGWDDPELPLMAKNLKTDTEKPL